MNNLTRVIIALIMIASTSGAQNTLNIEYSSDNRLMKNVVTLGVLENDMVIHGWEWNDIAKALDVKYGASEEDGGYLPAGLIAQDVQARYPDAIEVDNNGYLKIILPVLMERDEIIARLVLSGDASIIAGNWLAMRFLRDCFTADC